MEPRTSTDPLSPLRQWNEGIRAGRGFLVGRTDPPDWYPEHLGIDGDVDVYRNADGWRFAVGVSEERGGRVAIALAQTEDIDGH